MAALLERDTTPSRAHETSRALGFLVGVDGREHPITEAMVYLALVRVEADDLSLHGTVGRETIMDDDLEKDHG